MMARIAIWLESNQNPIAGSLGTEKDWEPNWNVLPG